MCDEAWERIIYNQSRLQESRLTNNTYTSSKSNTSMQPHPISINISTGSLTYNKRTPPIPINGNGTTHAMMINNKYINASQHNNHSPDRYRSIPSYSNSTNTNMTPSRYTDKS